MKNFSFKQLIISCLIILLNLNIAIAAPTGQNIYNYFATGSAKSDLNFTDLTNNVLGVIVWIGYAIAICVILFIGIQFLTATPQKKAQLKEKLWFIFIGTIILVGCVTILNIVASVMQNTVTPTAGTSTSTGAVGSPGGAANLGGGLTGGVNAFQQIY